MKNVTIDFNLLFNNECELCFIIDNDRTIIDLNDNVCTNLNYTREDLIGKHISMIVSNEDDLNNIFKNKLYLFNQLIKTKDSVTMYTSCQSNAVIVNDEHIHMLICRNLAKSPYLNSIISNIPYVFFMKQPLKDIFYINDFTYANIEVAEQDIPKITSSRLWNSEAYEQFRNEDKLILEEKKPLTFIEKLEYNGQCQYFETHKGPIYGSNKNILAISAISRNITKEIELNNKILKQNEELELLYKLFNQYAKYIDIDSLFKNISSDLRSFLSIDNTCVYICENNQVIRFYTYGMSDDLVESTAKNPSHIDFIKKISETKKCIPITPYTELNSTHINNIFKNFNMKYIAYYPILYSNHSVGVVAFSCKETTKSKDTYHNYLQTVCYKLGVLVQNSILYEKLKIELYNVTMLNNEKEFYFDNIADFLCITDNSGNFINIGQYMINELGYKRDEIIGKNFVDLIHPDDTKYILTLKEQIKTNKKVQNLSIRSVCKNGEYKYISWSFARYDVIGIVICSGKDITQIKLSEERTKQLEEKITLDKLKTEFLANISHELRTPLAIIYGTTSLIKSDITQLENSKNANKYIKTIEQNTLRLIRIVNNLIDITKFDAGFYKMQCIHCNIISVIEDITISISDYINGKGFEIIFDTDTEELYMDVDVDKIERIMLNLISNAVKFSIHGGQIFINLTVKNNVLTISVKDTGKGIPEKMLNLIFDRFIQTDDCFTKIAEGSGLGLSIVKSLVEQHNGTIEAKSELGKGAEFIINLPTDIKRITDDNNFESTNNFSVNVEKFNIEFADIYGFNKY